MSPLRGDAPVRATTDPITTSSRAASAPAGDRSRTAATRTPARATAAVRWWSTGRHGGHQLRPARDHQLRHWLRAPERPGRLHRHPGHWHRRVRRRRRPIRPRPSPAATASPVRPGARVAVPQPVPVSQPAPPPVIAARDTRRPTAGVSRLSCTRRRRCTFRIRCIRQRRASVAKLSATVSRRVRTCRRAARTASVARARSGRG